MFTQYNYLEEMKADIKNFLEAENYQVPNFKEHPEEKYTFANNLNFLLEDDDNITGNGSGSYTFDRGKAEEYIIGNLDLLSDAIKFFGVDALNIFEKGPEACDVIIRCYLLYRAICEVLDEIEEKQ